MATAELITRPLWAIEQDLQALLDTIDTTPEELLPEAQAALDAYLGAEVAKVDNISQALAICEYVAKDAAAEIKRLQDRKKAAEAAQGRLENYVIRVMKARGIKKLEGKTNTLSLRPSDGVTITDAEKIPSEFQTVTVTMPAQDWLLLKGSIEVLTSEAHETWTPDKTAIKKAIKGGMEVPGADLEFRSNLVRK